MSVSGFAWFLVGLSSLSLFQGVEILLILFSFFLADNERLDFDFGLDSLNLGFQVNHYTPRQPRERGLRASQRHTAVGVVVVVVAVVVVVVGVVV